MTIYLAAMPTDIPQLGALLRLFFLQLYEENTDSIPAEDPTVKHRCHVLLDEFTKIPPMSAFADAAGDARGFWPHFSYVVQSKNQVSEKYKGQGLASLFGNIGAEIVFGTDDLQLCKEASERAGYDTVTATTKTAPRFMSWFRAREQNETEHQHRRALLLPQEVARMPAGLELVFRASAPPFLLCRLRWYADPLFRDLQGPPPAVPAVSYTLARDDGSVQIHAPVARQRS
jgi:type IV secretion system protein VirD4